MTWRLDWDSLNNRDWRSAIDPGAWRESIRHFGLRFRDSPWQPATAIAVACFLGTSTAVLLLNAEPRDTGKVMTVEIAPAIQPAPAMQPAPEIAQAIQPSDDRSVAEIDALKSQLSTAGTKIAAVDAQLAEANRRLAEANRRLIDFESFQSPRKLTYDQRRTLIAALVPFRGQKLTITSVLGNNESRDYRDDFVQVFEAAGWDLGGEKGIQESAYDIDPVGIEVTVHQINEHEGLSNDAINELIKVLRQLDLFETGGPKMSPVVPSGQFEFRIGHKAHKTASR